MRRTLLPLVIAMLIVAIGCTPGGSTSDAPWTVVRSSPDSATVIVAYFHGSCDSLRSVHAISTPTTVTFEIRVHEDAGTCDGAGRSTAIRVRIGAELGDRTVTGACSQEPGVLCIPWSQLKAANLDLHDLPIYGP